MAETVEKILIVDLEINQDQALQDLTELQQEIVETKNATKELEKANLEAERARLRKAADDVSDTEMKVVGVVIGHVRGRLTAPTYRRLIASLALEVDEKMSEGLDAAMTRLLDKAGVEVGE